MSTFAYYYCEVHNKSQVSKPPLILGFHDVWHTTGVSDSGCKPTQNMSMAAHLTLAYHHYQLTKQRSVTLVISDSAMTDCTQTISQHTSMSYLHL